MILDGPIQLILSVVLRIVSPLANFGFNFNIENYAFFLQFVRMAMYLVPWYAFIPIFVFVVSTIVLRIAISLVKTLWDLLPLV